MSSLAGKGEQRLAEELGDRRRDDAAIGVRRRAAEEDQVEADLLERRRQHARRPDGVGACERGVGHQDAAISAHRQRLANGVGGGGGPHAERDDLAAELLLLAQAFFDGVFIEGIDFRVLFAALQPHIGGEAFLRRGGGRLFHAHDDIHGTLSSRDQFGYCTFRTLA